MATKFLANKLALLIVSFLFSLASFASDITDDDIAASIKKQIGSNPITASIHSVKLISDSGTIILTGAVKTDQQASALIEIAQSTPGVVDVNVEHLVVKESKQPLVDTLITAKIKGLFLRDKLFSEKEIASGTMVETKNGVVHLAGKASSEEAIKNAVQLAESVKGVKKVESHLILIHD